MRILKSVITANIFGLNHSCSFRNLNEPSKNMKEVTIYDIARKLNLSTATISRALCNNSNISEKTKRKVLQAADEMGYTVNHFARNLRNEKSNNLIGIIFHKLNSQFSINVLYGIEQIARNAGYDIIICHSSESLEQEISNAANLFKRRVNGLIVGLSSDIDNVEHLDSYIKNNIPVILFDRVKPDFNGIKVVIDNFKAAYNVTRHLIEQGCKNIVHIAGVKKSSVFVDRLNGYKYALAESNIQFKPEWLIYKNNDETSGIKISQKIMEMRPRPDGVFAVNDISAVMCMKELQKAGIRIPEDIAFAGFNNDLISTVIEPNLTTVDYSGIQMGEIAAKALLDAIANNTASEKNYTIKMNANLLIRASSKRSVLP
jgi:LacI family transcriptional regulator